MGEFAKTVEATPLESEVKPTEKFAESEVKPTKNFVVDETENSALEGEVESTENSNDESEVESAKNSGDSEAGETENSVVDSEGEQSTKSCSVVLVKSKAESAYDMNSVRLALHSPEESVRHSHHLSFR